MDIIEEYVKLNTLNAENVLRLVDEYTLYSHYLGYCPEIGIRYYSPIRDDKSKPSFTLFHSNNHFYEYLWKDHGGNGDSGAIFKLIKLMTGLSNINEVLNLIDQDFELGLGNGKPIDHKVIRFDKPTQREEVVIKVRVRKWNDYDMYFWNSQGISRATLDRYQVFPIDCFWTRDDQDYPFFVKGLAYAYLIAGKYKIYQPYNSDFKFITNYPSTYIEGFVQLRYLSDTLIITKSLKEVMWFSENLGIDAVAGKSESTPIPTEYISLFKSRYKKIIVFLDPDKAGYSQAMKYKDLYGFPWIPIYPCLLTGSKDPTDHNRDHGKEATIELVKLLMLNV